MVPPVGMATFTVSAMESNRSSLASMGSARMSLVSALYGDRRGGGGGRSSDLYGRVAVI